MNPLVVVPNYVTDPGDVALLADCVESIRKTEGEAVDVMIVDDCSPAVDLVVGFERDYAHLGFDLVRKAANEGFSRTVNVGLQRALDEGRDAILVNADLEFFEAGWLSALRDERCLHSDRLADVVGGLLCFPNGLIQHAGIYFSLLTRTFDHLHKYGPMDLAEAQVLRACPVTGALQYIRHDCLATVGLYDPEFRMGFEDVDFCLRVFLAGRECVYAPRARAWHHESVFRSRPSPKLTAWHQQSFIRLAEKYHDVNFATLVPAL